MQHFRFPPTLALTFVSLSLLQAQVGDQNPSGPSGIFNGQVTTGCSYDPYTGNATRSITDIVVAGGVGEYPLALVRTANSRTPSATEEFGSAGGWNHNYNWSMDNSPSGNVQNFQPVRYTVNYPDGRAETFQSVTWDNSAFRVRAIGGGAATSAGVRERFVPFNPPNNMYGYLVLSDGGKVKFQATQHQLQNGTYYYTYKAQAIIDPHGLETTLTWEVNGRRRLMWVTEPAGHSLHFSYTGPNSPRISQVAASDGRTVQYSYNNYGWLSSVRYYNNPSWTAYYQYTGSNVPGNAPPLLWTCKDPMYSGPMKRIAYEYKPGGPNDYNPDGTTPVYGQILRERYWDGNQGNELSGPIVSELTVGTANPANPNVRTETRGDIKTRTFNYTTAGYLTSCTDFMNHFSASQGYDTYKYINYVIDRRGNRTDYINDPITGNVTQIQFPLTPGDTPGQGNTRPTVNYSYTNTYYVRTIQGENGQFTRITRDPTSNRVTRIDYPDGGYEEFGYDAAHLYQPSSHRMTTGGTENWTYDSRHRKETYRNPDSPSPRPSPSARYYYDALDRVSGITDALNHSTNFDYNDRGQVTLIMLPWINAVRYTISSAYNSDGTLQSRTDELGTYPGDPAHTTNYQYDDYRRLKSVTPPVRGAGDTGIYVTRFYYGANAWDAISDYKYADSNVTYIVPPSTSTKKIQTVYDDNRRRTSVTVAPGTTEEATTSYSYDVVGNLSWVTNPGGHWINTSYDERNRPGSINDFGRSTTFTYDTAGRKKTITRPNGQVITYENYDVMNRLKQQRVTQTPEPDAVTKYTYYAPGEGPVGLFHTMQDPRLVATNSTEKYEYLYDLMGRKTWVRYPKDSTNTIRAEGFTYDDVGRLAIFRNRNGNYQTFTYDALSRMTGFSWDDTPRTPSVSFGYDAASRLTNISNANATISRSYYNDNLLRIETQSLSAIGGVDNRNVIYTYDADGNRASLGIPGYTFDYLYSNRNQVKFINNHANGLTQAYYEYNANGYVKLRNANTSPLTVSNYSYDGYDRLTSISHALNGTTRTFSYGYDNNSDNRLWAKRGITPTSAENNKGEAFSYDRADQAIAFQLNVSNPQNVSQPLPQNITYDANGNRTSFQAVQYGAANNLSQYTTRTGGTIADYDFKGNMITGLDGSTYTFDAQNRLLSATKNGVTMSFKYDGLNRQVSRTVSGITTYGTWDGWNLVEEYTNSPRLAIQARYLYGPTGLVKELQNNRYYCQDGSGSTALLADSTGRLLEWYRYDLQGTPFFYAPPNDTQRSTSNYSVRHLFTGQQWYQDIGLYDLRNRFYSPDLGRFLHPDPIGFRGDRTNLYRYCRNNPVTRWDPFGLQLNPRNEGGGGEGVIVNGSFDDPNDHPSFNPMPSPFVETGPGGLAEFGLTGHMVGDKYVNDYNPFPRPRPNDDDQPMSVVPPQNPPQPSIDPFHATTTAEFIAIGNMIERGNTMDTTPPFDLLDLFSGCITGLVRSSIRSVGAKIAATGFRYVSKGEAQIIRKTGLIPRVDRFGNAKNIFYTNESFTSAAEAQQALSLASTPAFRVEFNLGRAPVGYGGIADPLFGQPGGGAEFILREGADPIRITLIVPLGE